MAHKTRFAQSTLRVLLLAGSAGLALGTAASAQGAKRVHYDLPASDLGTALNQVARQGRQEIVFDSALVRGKRAAPLVGDYTPAEALDRVLAGSGLAVRQNASGAEVITSAAPLSQGPATELAEVVVTAQKRKEDVRKISGSVTAYTSQQLEKIGAEKMEDYLTLTPGVAFYSDVPGLSRAVLRGVSTTTSIDQGQATVGYFINDVPLTDPYFTVAIPDIDAFDVDNVVVLRGPQGTLFGSATLGGSINYQAAKPDLSAFQSHVQVGVEGVDGGGVGASGKLMVNLPVVPDVFGVRAVYVYRNTPGYVDDVGTGEKNANSNLVRGGRVEAAWTPTATTSVNYMFLDQAQDTADSGYIQPQFSGALKKQAGFPEAYKFRTVIHNLRLDQDLGFGVLTATATYHKKTQNSVQDLTGFFGPLLPGTEPIHIGQFAYAKGTTFEARLASKPGEKLEYLVGAMHDDTRENIIDNFFSANAQQLVETTYGGLFGPGIGQAGAPNNVFYFANVLFRGKETAAFGEASYHIDDQWKITLGGRAFETEARNTSTDSGFFNLLTSGALNTTLQGRQKERGFTPKVALTWTPNDNFMAYALASKGFRFGGPNINPSTPANPIPATFGSDSLWNYELGLRSSLFNRRLLVDATAFYVDWSGIQLRLNTPAGLAYAKNAGRARNYGLEGSTNWLIAPGLTLQTNLTYLEAALASDFDPGAGQPIIRKGTALPGSAKWQVSNVLSYDWHDGPGRPQFVVTHRYSSSRAQDFTFPTDLGSYSLVDGRVTFRVRDDATLTIFANNIGNRHALSAGQDVPGKIQHYIFTPRTFGLTFDYRL